MYKCMKEKKIVKTIERVTSYQDVSFLVVVYWHSAVTFIHNLFH
jgi:hypothetical protein